MELVFVLVRPAVPENVGAAARALKTMGFDRLRIVGSTVHSEHKASILAHGSRDILAAATDYPDLGSALVDVDLAVATSAKNRHDMRYELSPAELRQALAAKRGSVRRAAIVFGCEESGLSNSELEYCQLLTRIPLANPYPSLNLGQAVMLYAYELAALPLSAQPSSPLPSEAGWRALHRRLQKAAEMLALTENSAPARWALERVGQANDEDVRLLHLWLAALEKRLQSNPGDPPNNQ